MHRNSSCLTRNKYSLGYIIRSFTLWVSYKTVYRREEQSRQRKLCYLETISSRCEGAMGRTRQVSRLYLGKFHTLIIDHIVLNIIMHQRKHCRDSDGWLYAIQTLRNAMTAQSFLASTVLSLLTLITGKVWDILRSASNTWERRLLIIQLLTISATMLFSANQFLQGVR